MGGGVFLFLYLSFWSFFFFFECQEEGDKGQLDEESEVFQMVVFNLL